MPVVDLDLIDTKSLFDALDIEYYTKGKNVTKGWINIQCPFCMDGSNHLGINLKSNLFSCWACNEKGSVLKLIKKIKEISHYQAKVLASNYVTDNITYNTDEKYDSEDVLGDQDNKKLVYPTGIVSEMPEVHRKYLISRNFKSYKLTKKYDLKFTFNTGNLRFRIIAPIYNNHIAVSWIAADVIRENSDVPPYIKCSLENSIISANECLYNIDSVKTTAIIVEGITDVWRIGDGSVATMTKSINDSQINQLITYHVNSVFVMFDSDAFDKAQESAKKLSAFFKTEIIQLDKGDPADLSNDEVLDIRKNIFK